MVTLVQEKVDNFFKNGKQIVLKKGQVLLYPEDPIEYVYYLTKGIVKMDYIGKNGEEITLHMFEKYSYFPMMLLLADSPNHYTFQALIGAEVWKRQKSDVMQFINENPEVLGDVTKRIAKGVVGLMTKIQTTFSEDSYHKVVSLLLYLAKKFGKKQGTSIEIALPLTHTDIAYWLGIQRETVSRQLEKLMKKDIVTDKKHIIIIHNLSALEKEFLTLQ